MSALKNSKVRKSVNVFVNFVENAKFGQIWSTIIIVVFQTVKKLLSKWKKI